MKMKMKMKRTLIKLNHSPNYQNPVTFVLGTWDSLVLE